MGQRDKLAENLLANGVDLATYVTQFRWDMAKYPIKQSLKNLSEIISKQVSQIEGDLKSKANAYNSLKSSLQSIEKKQTGSLVTRNLADLVKSVHFKDAGGGTNSKCCRKEHFVLDSEYLVTLLVVVPLVELNNWNNKYEKQLTDMIVPRSSQLIYQDNDHALVSVTLFQKVVEEFKVKARENKFLVRDFVYDEEQLKSGKNELTKLHTDKKKQFGPLVRWLKVNFGESFTAWIHVKALRVFVESVLRFGLPVNFQGMVILPQKKTIKKLRETLNDLYFHLDSAGGYAGADDLPAGLGGFGGGEYYPYVYYKMNIDMVSVASVM